MWQRNLALSDVIMIVNYRISLTFHSAVQIAGIASPSNNLVSQILGSDLAQLAVE